MIENIEKVFVKIVIRVMKRNVQVKCSLLVVKINIMMVGHFGGVMDRCVAPK